MKTSLIEAPTMGDGFLAMTGGEEPKLSLLFARYWGRDDIKWRMQEEDAAIEAEDILAQAEEANALDPVG